MAENPMVQYVSVIKIAAQNAQNTKTFVRHLSFHAMSQPTDSLSSGATIDKV